MLFKNSVFLTWRTMKMYANMVIAEFSVGKFTIFLWLSKMFFFILKY